MHHDKTIYILKAYIKESVMGRVLFSRGGTPSPHRGGLLPPIFPNNFFCKKYIFSDRGHSTDGLRRKKKNPGRLAGGLSPPFLPLLAHISPFLLEICTICVNHFCLKYVYSDRGESKEYFKRIFFQEGGLPGGGCPPKNAFFFRILLLQ